MNSTIIYLLLVITVSGFAIHYNNKRHPRRDYPVWRHVKTDTEYAVISTGVLEATQETCVIYTRLNERGSALGTGHVWVRGYNEFHDGRFVSVRTITV